VAVSMVFAISYGFGAGAFLALITLILINGRPKARGRYILIVCMLTLIWATAAAVQSWWMPGLAHAAESLSAAGWVILLAHILMTAPKEDLDRGQLRILAAVSMLVAVAAVANDVRFLQGAGSSFTFMPSQIFARIGVAICGLLLMENLFRNTAPGRRWHVYPFCIAIGFLFAFNLFV